MNEEETTILVYKNITFSLYSRKGKKLMWCERDRRRQTEMEEDEGRLPY